MADGAGRAGAAARGRGHRPRPAARAPARPTPIAEPMAREMVGYNAERTMMLQSGGRAPGRNGRETDEGRTL